MAAPPIDLWEVDIRRFMPFQGNRRYLHDRTTETLGLLYDMHWPFRQVETARGVRRSPFHDRLAARGACFGELAGWERANWYAPAGVAPRYEYSYERQNWFAHSAAEHRAVREEVGLFDQTSFGKMLVRTHRWTVRGPRLRPSCRWTRDRRLACRWTLRNRGCGRAVRRGRVVAGAVRPDQRSSSAMKVGGEADARLG
jgi:hypothetical protein